MPAAREHVSIGFLEVAPPWQLCTKHLQERFQSTYLLPSQQRLSKAAVTTHPLNHLPHAHPCMHHVILHHTYVPTCLPTQ